MKKLALVISTIWISLYTWAGIHTYADHSVLSEGKVVKVRVEETGIHCIPYDTLKSWGLKPEQVRVLGYGGNMLSENFLLPKWDDLPSVAFYMHKGSDNVFNSGDYILFYARGTVKWEFRAGRWVHTQHPYSLYGYYFISDTAGEQRLIPQASALDGNNAYHVDWNMEYMVHEKDSINLIDRSGVSGGGREFYGETLFANKPKLTITFPTQNVLLDKPMICFADVAAASSKTTKMTIELANATSTANISAISVSDFYTKAECDSIVLVTNAVQSEKQQVKLTFDNSASGALGFLNYIELNVPTALKMRGNELAINNTTYLNNSKNTKFLLANANSSTKIWRVTDGVNIEEMPTSWQNDTLVWVGSNKEAEQYVALNVDTKNWKKPQKVEVVKNQDLHALRNIDYVIICPEEFVEQATRLAKKHEEVDHITWAVVTDQQVYNEFSSGTPDVTAYRWLMKMLYDRAKGNVVEQPKNLLLMGNASYDNRKLLNSSGVSRILVYEAYNSTVETQAYANDDYCGFLLDNAGVDPKGQFNEVRAQMNIGVGRLPLRTIEQAKQVVDKLCTYMDDLILNKWKNQICFLADDGDHGLHVQTADGGAEKLRKENLDFVVNKIYLDAYTQEVNAAGESYPLAKSQFDNLMSNGVLFMNYSGHGGYNNITNELFMSTKDIQRMTNANQGFWFLATCSFSHFDGGIPSAGEEAILNPNGGAIGVLSACRTVYATQNTIINRNLCDTLFGHQNLFSYNMTLGEATRIAKNMTGRDSNKMAYVLLGDPAIRLNYPTDYQVVTTTKMDTLQALTIQTIKGYIQSPEGDTATWFNGHLDVTIFDKMQQITTRDNDATDEASKVKITYNDYPNTLFAGKTSVQDGLFEYTFMVPKDIRYNYGNGRIVYYACDEEAREEGVGHFEDFVIGGSSSVEIIDTLGPEINLYLNNPAFVDGSQTYEYPHFYANIYDENGINTVGTGIGHDLLLIVDEDPKMTYVLNDYFIAQNNSYQQGLVSYKMPEMEEGQHSLTFRAWDLINNSNTEMLNFQVVKGLDPNIYQVVTYPNPVASTETLNIRIEFDQPDEVIQTTIYLYDLSGRLVKEHQQKGTTGIQWNLSEMNVQPGIYVYNVKIKSSTSNYVSKAGKIIVCE